MAGVRPDDVVLEVGAADGLLTQRLRRAGALRARLRDRRALRGGAQPPGGRPRRPAPLPGRRACATGSPTWTPAPTAVVANLAYNIAMPLLMRDHRHGAQRAALGGDAPARARRAAVRRAAHQGLLGRVGARAALLRARGAAAGAAHGVRAAAARRFRLRHLHAQRAGCRPTSGRARHPGAHGVRPAAQADRELAVGGGGARRGVR